VNDFQGQKTFDKIECSTHRYK